MGVAIKCKFCIYVCVQIDDKRPQLIISVKCKISRKKYCAYIYYVLMKISQLTIFRELQNFSQFFSKGVQISHLTIFR